MKRYTTELEGNYWVVKDCKGTIIYYGDDIAGDRGYQEAIDYMNWLNMGGDK